MDKQPTEARQDELKIRERALLTDEEIKLAKNKIIKKHYPRMFTQQIKSLMEVTEADKEVAKAQQDKDFSLPVSTGGRVCPECRGEKVRGRGEYRHGSYHTSYMDCPACNGTGQKPIVTKTLGEIIKEALK